MARRLRNRIVLPPTDHSLVATLEGTSDPQATSPLFSTIPAELRNRIFHFALMSTDDKSAPYPENSYYTRPGYRYRQRIHTGLLATCRRIYRETHDLPVSLNEHTFWCNLDRGPAIRDCDNPKAYFKRMTIEQQEAVVDVHLFTQLYWLEDMFPNHVCQASVMKAKHIKITVRHTDWWNWESNSPLAMHEGWGRNLKAIEGLESVEIELETMERDKNQLETIAKAMYKWRFGLGRGRTLTTEGTQIAHDRYIGQSSFISTSQYDIIEYNAPLGIWISDYDDNAALNHSSDAIPNFAYNVITLQWVPAEAK